MSIIYKGETQVFRGPLYEYRAGQGDTTGQVYEFPTKELAESFYQQQRGGQNDVRFNSADGPPYRVEVSVPALDPNTPDDSYEDQWELPPVETTKSIFETDAFRALASAEQSALRSLAADPGQDYDAILEQLTSATAVNYSLLILRGTTEIQSPTCGLRWTRIVGRNYGAVSAAYSSVNRIFSLGTITSLSGMPANIVTAVTRAQNNIPNAASGYATGWLKKMSSITYRGAGRVEITQEWTLENWSTVLYGNLV